MKKGLIALFVIFGTVGFAQDNSFKAKHWTILDSNKGDQLLRQCSRTTPKKISGYWNLSEKDILTLERHFLKVKEVTTANYRAVRNLDKVVFQYIGVTIKKKKYIYINALHLDNDEEFNTIYKNWKTDPIVVCDGGDYYWGALFDLDKLKFEQLAINGV